MSLSGRAFGLLQNADDFEQFTAIVHDIGYGHI
jgi:hypothetical protein